MTAVLLDVCLESFQASLLQRVRKLITSACSVVWWLFVLFCVCLGILRVWKVKKKVFYHIVEFWIIARIFSLYGQYKDKITCSVFQRGFFFSLSPFISLFSTFWFCTVYLKKMSAKICCAVPQLLRNGQQRILKNQIKRFYSDRKLWSKDKLNWKLTSVNTLRLLGDWFCFLWIFSEILALELLA